MTKSYLGMWQESGHVCVEITERPSRVLERAHGLTSPIFPASVDGAPARIDEEGALLFLVGSSPTSLLAALINDFAERTADRVFISHGHAAIVLTLGSRDACEELVSLLADRVVAHEIWSYAGNRVVDRFIAEPAQCGTWVHPAEIASAGVSAEAAAQVAQFNSNLALLSRIASQYAPETRALVSSLHASISDIAEQLRDVETLPDGDRLWRSRNLEGVLVEANAVVTLYCSQLSSGTLPLGADVFPVGEYSLLGIGSMSRGAWRIYSHLNDTFAQHDHIGVFKRIFTKTPGFDPYAPSGRLDYSEWRKLKSSVRDLTDGVPANYQQHVPYFSSRWGFHEAMHSISMSWQCLYASASRQWNLLTVTHEYLHAHVKGIFSHIIRPGDEDVAARLCRLHNAGEKGSSTLESLQVAYVEALISIESFGAIAEQIDGADQELRETMPRSIDPRALAALNRRHADLMHEIVVHVLDFRYVYDGRDDAYVDSVWSSWSQVPSVAGRIDHYVLRTLCSLAATTTLDRSPEIFKDVVERLRAELIKLTARASSGPVVQAALDLLDDSKSNKRLQVEFSAARYVVELARNFFFDALLNAELVRDDLTAVIGGRRTYGVEVGEYRGEAISSPIGFLLDMFEQYPDEAEAEAVEHASIWQMLQLV